MRTHNCLQSNFPHKTKKNSVKKPRFFQLSNVGKKGDIFCPAETTHKEELNNLSVRSVGRSDCAYRSFNPTSNALLICFRLSSDAEILSMGIDRACKSAPNVQTRVRDVYVFWLSSHFACRRWWLGSCVIFTNSTCFFLNFFFFGGGKKVKRSRNLWNVGRRRRGERWVTSFPSSLLSPLSPLSILPSASIRTNKSYFPPPLEYMGNRLPQFFFFSVLGSSSVK